MNIRRSIILCLPASMLMGADGPPTAPAKLPSTSARAAPVPAPVSLAPVQPKAKKQMVKRNHARPAATIPPVARANRAALREPVPRGFMNAVQIFHYSEGAIYHVYTAPERVTDIALEPGEMLGAVASGDTVRWVVGDTTSGAGESKRTHILVKPFSSGLSTNLVVTTDRRTYHLALTSTSSVAMTALSWTYPHDALIAFKRKEVEAAAAVPVAAGFDVAQLRFDYVISGGTPAWRPLRAFDDGRQTFIEFSESIMVGEAPPLFIVNARGDAELVNYRMRGRHYIVDRLFDIAELRLGTKDQQIVRIRRGKPVEDFGRKRS